MPRPTTRCLIFSSCHVPSPAKRYAETDGWGFYNFNHHEPKAPTATVKAKSDCAYCHIASAKKDQVWTQFYPLLDK